MDCKTNTGLNVQGIGADIKITIKGRDGMVISAEEQTWWAGSWRTPESSYFILNGNYIEGTFLYDDNISSPQFTFESISWYNNIDIAPSPASF
ncbi:MAG TPA: hypothetical protein ENN76_01425 [Euryarchaeota archaeon]|nr:hypothetical protein [Euryarchaeota archaeon]